MVTEQTGLQKSNANNYSGFDFCKPDSWETSDCLSCSHTAVLLVIFVLVLIFNLVVGSRRLFQ